MYDVIGIFGIVLFALIILFSLWLNFFLTRKLLHFSENINDLNGAVDGFVGHLDSLYELPLFYGDANLQELIDHSKQLREDLIEFRESYKSQ